MAGMLSPEQGKLLLGLARQVLEKKLSVAASAPPLDRALFAAPCFQAKQGVFVTLKKKGELRGCIGSLTTNESVVDGIAHQAVNAALHDYRFTPLSPAELAEVAINISVLTEPQPLPYRDGEDLVRKLRPGTDGVILQEPGGRGATFLPQVWEQIETPELFLSHLCRKAGLAADAWQQGNLEILTYQVQYFEEDR